MSTEIKLDNLIAELMTLRVKHGNKHVCISVKDGKFLELSSIEVKKIKAETKYWSQEGEYCESVDGEDTILLIPSAYKWNY